MQQKKQTYRLRLIPNEHKKTIILRIHKQKHISQTGK